MFVIIVTFLRNRRYIEFCLFVYRYSGNNRWCGWLAGHITDGLAAEAVASWLCVMFVYSTWSHTSYAAEFRLCSSSRAHAVHCFHNWWHIFSNKASTG